MTNLSSYQNCVVNSIGVCIMNFLFMKGNAMSYLFHTLPVVKFVICDDDEGTHEADNNRDFEESEALLNRLREENPCVCYLLYAEVDA